MATVKLKQLVVVVAASIVFGYMMALRDNFQSVWIRAGIAAAAFGFFTAVMFFVKRLRSADRSI